MFDLPDAPDIARTMRTGYPDIPEKYHCAECGAPAEVYGETSGYLCLDCALDTWDGLTTKEQLDLLGFEYL